MYSEVFLSERFLENNAIVLSEALSDTRGEEK
jgi:hypothetical protein